MTGATLVPRPICYAALYRESKYGRSLGFTEAYNDRDALTAKIADLELKNRALATEVDALRNASAAVAPSAVNDAVYLPRDAAPTARRLDHLLISGFHDACMDIDFLLAPPNCEPSALRTPAPP